MSFYVSATIIRLVKEFSPDFSVEEELSNSELQCFLSVKRFLQTKAAGCDTWGESEPERRQDEDGGGEDVSDGGSENVKRMPIQERHSAEQLRKIVRFIATTLINESMGRTHSFGA